MRWFSENTSVPSDVTISARLQRSGESLAPTWGVAAPGFHIPRLWRCEREF
ncbi:MAG: hypothetical protein ACRD9S_16395 [Pyrinomonadaceae bacterium]